jgi:hypothetical protein
MSRFSFRAYHKNAGRYLEGGYDLSCKVGLNSFGELVSGDPAIIIEQSTGLCDCEGKEIFEGDIVKERDFDGLKGVVVFKDGQFMVSIIATGTNNDGLERDLVWWSWQIIGNVHEEAK